MDDSELFSLAVGARERAYAPYSGFAVGAALLDAEGQVWLGANIENAALGSTICAERVAIFKAVSEGVRSFSAIAVAGGPVGEGIASFTAPCGACRQVMREFCTQDFRIILGDAAGELRVFTLAQLLPESFGPEALGTRQ